MLDALKAGAAVQVEKDVIMTFGAWETDVYGLEVEQAYLDITATGAWMAHVLFKDADNRKITLSECVASNKTGTLKTTYTDKKSGKEVLLPGYSKILSLFHVAVDQNIADISAVEVENKAIKCRVAGEDKVVEKPVFVGLLGKHIFAAVQKETVDKFKKNDSTNKYDIPDGTREQNSFEKFYNEDGKTNNEFAEGKDAIHREEWVKAFGGKTRNRAKNKPNEQGSAGAPAAKATPELKWD